MGRLSMDEVVDLIHNAGYRCERGYPGRRSPVIQIPAVAVNVQQEDADGTTMAVYVFCPVEDGAAECEDLAQAIAALLRKNGAVCTQEHCTHDGRGDRFSVRILASWAAEQKAPPYSVSMGGWERKYVTAFSVRQNVEITEVGAMGQNEPVDVLRRDKGWQITLQELIPNQVAEPSDPEEPFTVILRRGTIGEVYGSCYWISVLREDTVDGLRMTRVARAGSRSVLDYG